jgi:hypothetical protein
MAKEYFGLIYGTIPEHVIDKYIFQDICCTYTGFYKRYEICKCPAFDYDLYTECVSYCSHSKIYQDTSILTWKISKYQLPEVINIVYHNNCSSLERSHSVPDNDFLYTVGKQIIDVFQKNPGLDELIFCSTA